MKNKIDVHIYRTDNRAAREGEVYVELIRRNGRSDIAEDRLRYDYADAAPFLEMDVLGIYKRFDDSFSKKETGKSVDLRIVHIKNEEDETFEVYVQAIRYSLSGLVIAARSETLDVYPELQELFKKLDSLTLEGKTMDESIALAEVAKTASQET
jgi:hypothetical protein